MLLQRDTYVTGPRNCKYSCGVCYAGVGANSILCSGCNFWVHSRCSGTRGSLTRLKGPFICKRCLGECSDDAPVTVFEVEGHRYEMCDTFCYLGDTLNVGGGCSLAVATRIRSAWNKFRDLSGVLLSKGVSLRMKGVVYKSCVRPAMIYASETWAVKAADTGAIQRTEMRMLRWMAGASLRERKSSAEIRIMLNVEDVAEVTRRSRLRWFGHTQRREEDAWINKIQSFNIEGRPKK